MTLPVPAPGRFKPLRCGLVELFLYEAQEFPFRDGRLLLRGDNGSGKSKVLALTLPLLLDASLAPARLEPDADPNKRMAWNLLMGDAHDERTGYSWVEFGRVDEDGTAHFVTLGLGAKAVRQKGVVKHWWFLTDQRIGDELYLVDRSRTVRTRERLAEAIGDRGAVFDTADRYRRAVDEALFGLQGRYDALVDLLVHLRQPQLSKRPNEEQLGRALTEALPPMPESLIDTVAQSYQALEDEERAVYRLRSSAAAVRAFTFEYERYSRIVTLRATVTPRRAQSEYEEQNRKAREADTRLGAAREELAAAESAVKEAKIRLADRQGARESLRGLLDSDEMKQYAAAHELAAAKRAAAIAVDGALSMARAAHDDAQDSLREALDDTEGARAAVANEHDAVAAHAATAGIVLPLDGGDTEVTAPASGVEVSIGEASTAEIARRRDHVTHLEALLQKRDHVDIERARAHTAVDDAEARLETEDHQMREAQDAASAAASTWIERSRQYLGATQLLRGDGLDAAVDAAADWAAALSGDGPNPLARWVATVVRLRDAEFEDERVAQDHELKRLALLISALDEEIASLTDGGIRRPRAPHTRARTRDGAAGAAFWECVDLRPGVTVDLAAGIEAALEAAGVLDAWVGADGVATTADGDVVLRPVPLAGPTLAEVLVGVAVRDVSAQAVDVLLQSIALDDVPVEGSIAVSTRGTFALGPLVGSWQKPTAEYLGATAREGARLARLAEATNELELLILEREEWQRRREALREHRASLVEEGDHLPNDAEVRSTGQAAASAAVRRTDADSALAGRRVALEIATEAHTTASAAADAAAALYAISVDGLGAVRSALDALPEAIERLLDAAHRLAQLDTRARGYETKVSDAAAVRADAESDAERASGEAVRAEQRRDTLEATVGKEAHEIREQLDAVETEIEALGGRLSKQEGQQEQASNAHAVAESQIESIASDVADATTARNEATESFRLFSRTGLLELATPGLDVPDPESVWSPDPTVRLARRVLELLGGQDVADEGWDTAVNRLWHAFEALQGELSTQGRQTAWDQDHGVTVVTVQHGSEYIAPDRLSAELEDELADRERLLTEKERAILETHLIDEVGANLHERVREAMQQVHRMNEELARHQTRSGLKLRIVWEPTDGELDKEGRTLLQQSSAAWSPADREAIGEYLRSRISAARAEDPEGSWHERLIRAFDYRSWNRFSVQLHQNGAWRPASGPASGGERVLAASVPLFAAAASHYASAGNPHAPRLILLDEAFAGVDDRSRASYLGLLAEFDLDVVMTSEREWATYPEVPGIAIANLFRLPGADAVHVEHWTWNGIARERVSDPGMTAIEVAPPEIRGDDSFILDLGDLA